MASTFRSAYHNLLCAASGGDVGHVRELLQQGVFPGVTSGPDGCTALHAAAEAGEDWAVPILIDAGFDPNTRTTDGRTPLSLAASRRDLDVVAALLKGGASVHAADSSGNTPLHVAAGMGNAAMIQALLAAGASSQAADKLDSTPLHMACSGNHWPPRPWHAVAFPFNNTLDILPYDSDRAEAARVLLEAGAVVNSQNSEGETPLMLASRYGHKLLLEALLANAAQPTTRNKRGWNALLTACWCKHAGVVSRLLEVSQVRKQLEVVNADGQTALVLACQAGADRVVLLLLAAGADFNALTPCGLRPLHAAVIEQHLSVLDLLLIAGADPSAADSSGRTGIHLAGATGQRDAVLKLLAARAEPHAVNQHQRTALHAAAEGGHQDAVVVLLVGGADPAAVDLKQQTALHLAAAAGHRCTVQVLLAGGADPRAVDQQQQDALQIAAAAGHWGTVKALLGGGADPRALYQQLHQAATAGQWQMVHTLLSAGADPRAADPQQQSVLHVAAKAGQQVIVQMLSATGADPCAVDQHQQSVLHVAAAAGHSVIVRVLLGRGADFRAVNQQQQSVLHVAAAAGQQYIVQQLLAAGADPRAVDQQQQSVLHVAVVAGYPGMVQMLLAAWANPGAVDQQQQSVLHVAVVAGRAGILQQLLAAGADLRAVDQQHQTVMHVAVMAGRPTIVQLLLAAGANPRAVDAKQQNALHVAAAAGRSAIVEIVLAALAAGRRRGDIDVMARGMTALHLAIKHRSTTCLEALLAAGADPDKVLGEGALDCNGVSIAGASTLFYAALSSHTDAIRLLANPTRLRQRSWRGQTPLHQALYLDKPDMAQLLMAAGSPAGVTDNNLNTAMDLAARSSKPELRALLPAMVRGECELHLQQQQQEEEQGQQEGQEGQVEHAAVPAAVAKPVHSLLRGCSAAGEEQGLQQAVPCISMVLDVLGPTAASCLLQQVMERWMLFLPAAANRCGMQLLRLVHTGWLTAWEPLLDRRQTVTSRLWWLVTQPLQQLAVAAGDKQQASYRQLTTPLCRQLWDEALTAGDAGQWGLLVQRLEQLAGLQPPECRRALYAVAAQKGWVRPPAVVGLCEALLGAWAAGRQQAARRVVQEVADGVVSAVQVWEQQRAGAGVEFARLRLR
jgi:ankyrin